MYERFKNDFLMQLVEDPTITPEQTKTILQALDTAIYNYDITQKETRLVVYNQDIPHLVKLFLISKKVEGFSDQTLYNYKLFLNKFFFFVQKDPEKVTANDIRVFLYQYQKDRAVTNRSLNKVRDSLSSFYAWLCDENYIDKNPVTSIKKIKYEKKERQPVTQIELEYLRRECKTLKQKAILEVLYSTGCRVGELVSLTKSDIDWQAKTVHLFGKDNKHRTSFLNAKAEVALIEYLNSRSDDSEYLFVSDRKPYSPMHVCGVQKILRGIVNRAGEHVTKKVTPHVLRHTTATRMLESGVSISSIQHLLGHENINTTMIYAHDSLESIQTDHRKSVV